MAKNHPDAGKTLGSASCALCGARVLVKVNVKGLPYYNCDTKDDGCGSQIQPRTADSARHLCRKIEKWNDPAKRLEMLGDEALPAKARKQPDADPPPADDPPPPGDDDQGDDAPADPPPADDPPPPPKPKRAAPKRTPPPAQPTVRLFGRKWS